MMISEQDNFNRAHAARVAAILQVLLDKGVVTEAELEQWVARFSRMADEILTQKRDEYMKSEEGKSVSILMKLLGVDQ